MNHLAVADNTGNVTIRQVIFKRGADLNNIVKTLTEPKEWVECMSYNPYNTRLAVGSHDNWIYIYNCELDYKTNRKLVGHSSYISGFDWSLSSNPNYIRSNCGAYELLFFNADTGKQDPSGASNT